MKTYLTAIACVAMPIVVGCQATAPVPGEQVSRSFTKRIIKTVSYDYLLYLPTDYPRRDCRWPLVLFLHGAGERGHNLDQVKQHGPPMLVVQGRQFPFILVSPQCPLNKRWDPEALNALLDDVIASYAVDEDRVYVTGLSMGGYGTWDLATNYPHRFAAIAPVCGGGAPWVARTELKKMPTWVFHGDQDSVVPFVFAEKMVEAMKKVHAPVKFTVYPGVGHNSWTETYNNPELYDWLLSQKRQPATAPAQ